MLHSIELHQLLVTGRQPHRTTAKLARDGMHNQETTFFLVRHLVTLSPGEPSLDACSAVHGSSATHSRTYKTAHAINLFFVPLTNADEDALQANPHKSTRINF